MIREKMNAEESGIPNPDRGGSMDLSMRGQHLSSERTFPKMRIMGLVDFLCRGRKILTMEEPREKLAGFVVHGF